MRRVEYGVRFKSGTRDGRKEEGDEGEEDNERQGKEKKVETGG